MAGPAAELIAQFGNVEDDQRYTRLAALFAEDGIYVDPLFGVQSGKSAVTEFLAHMEVMVPKAKARFEDWEVHGDTSCGWSRWTMVAPNAAGEEVRIPGQSLYRIRDGRVCFAADYFDNVAYRNLRGTEKLPDFTLGHGLSARFAPDEPGPARRLLARFWELQDTRAYSRLADLFTEDAVFSDQVFGVFSGHGAVAEYLARMEREMNEGHITFELVDGAGDETVAWSQWICHVPGGSFPGWTLHRVRDGRFTLDADYFDVLAARRLAKANAGRGAGAS